jgi:hypothetical protein
MVRCRGLRRGDVQRHAVPGAMVPLIALLTFGCSAFSGSSALPAPPDFSGSWQLDRAKSDDPFERMRELMPRRGGPPAGMGRPEEAAPADEPARDRFGRPTPRDLPEGKLGARRRALSALLEPAESLLVEQDGPYLLVHIGGGQTLELHLRPMETRDSVLVGGRSWPARWSGRELTHERDAPGGGTIIEAYRLEDSGRQLVIHTRFHPPDRVVPEISVRRTYERRPAS